MVGMVHSTKEQLVYFSLTVLLVNKVKKLQDVVNDMH